MNTSPRVYLIGHPTVNKDEVREWLDSLGATEYQLNDADTDCEALIKLAAKRCYMSFQISLNPNVTKIREDTVEYIDNILASRHGSVLTHVVYNFAIEGVSRIFTAEMNRHSVGMAISEGSLRYIRFREIPWWVPDSLCIQDGDDEDIIQRKIRTQEVFQRAFQQAEHNYRKLEDIWELTGERANTKTFSVKKKLTSVFRRIIPMGVATGGVWSGNIRALRHVLTMRLDPAAEEEINLVARLMLEKMLQAEPVLFGDFHEEDGHWSPKYVKV